MTASANPPRALVTGASEGIGRAIAREFAAAGYAVTGVARSEDRLRAVIDALGPGHTALVADLATEEGRKRVVQAVQRTPFDVLVNNAGTATAGPFSQLPLDTAAAMLDLNCHALVTLAQAFLAGARPGDALVNVSSTLAFAPCRS
ncbi:SDR family NAD(P)-dependent oxidoreductase [Streptomyces sp. SYSU K21746]